MLRLAARLAISALLFAAALHIARPVLDRARTLPAPIGTAAEALQRIGDTVAGGLHSTTAPCHVNGLLPDRSCTPGVAVRGLRLSVLCRYGYTASVRNVPLDVKRTVYRRYGISRHAPGQFEVDHLIPLAVGGSNDERNLWPQAAPGYHRKDRIEADLARAVCARRVSLADAQHAIASDWTTAMRRLGLDR